MIQSVIGSMFGDEGKGLTVDYLSSKLNPENSLIIRFSGGHQCGHTVHFKDKRHVFRCFGSGSFRGLKTYFSEDTCVYPNILLAESLSLKAKGAIYKDIKFHPNVKLTTPYDVALNRIQEKMNSNGSTGMGIGTTMARNIKYGFNLVVADILHKNILYAKIEAIKDFYLNRLVPEEYKQEFINYSNSEMSVFREGINSNLIQIEDYDYLLNFSDLIFDGSQGLLLDMSIGIFPNVTYSDLTSRAINKVLKESSIRFDLIDTYYITRCYLTRHGKGWFPNNGEIHLIENEEETNVKNLWQGQFRITEFDKELVEFAIKRDMLLASNIQPNIVITCLNQRPGFQIPNFEMTQWLSYSKDASNFIKWQKQ